MLFAPRHDQREVFRCDSVLLNSHPQTSNCSPKTASKKQPSNSHHEIKISGQFNSSSAEILRALPRPLGASVWIRALLGRLGLCRPAELILCPSSLQTKFTNTSCMKETFKNEVFP